MPWPFYMYVCAVFIWNFNWNNRNISTEIETIIFTLYIPDSRYCFALCVCVCVCFTLAQIHHKFVHLSIQCLFSAVLEYCSIYSLLLLLLTILFSTSEQHQQKYISMNWFRASCVICVDDFLSGEKNKHH